jgi:REP element-mobilizing transposase RayT
MCAPHIRREGIMSNTYTQIYIQVVFAVKGRQNLILQVYEDELYRYIGGILKIKGHKSLAINGMPDHIHVFIGMKPTEAISDLIRDIKANSSGFINDKKWFRGKFHWQEGFGGFSYSHSQLNDVIGYINNQKEHHKKESFRDEYISLLREFSINYDNKYVYSSIKGYE